jgi:hypothetical protein
MAAIAIDPGKPDGSRPFNDAGNMDDPGGNRKSVHRSFEF